MLRTLSLLLLAAADPALPPGDKRPVLRLEAGGPTSFVTALAFAPDGRSLSVAGWDKVVRSYALAADGSFAPDKLTYRVPLGPELQGAVNCTALSADGRYLAVAGRGVVRTESGFRQNGRVWPSDGTLTDAMREDLGLVYVFDTTDRSVVLLRGHTDAVEALAFAPPRAGRRPELVSVARQGGGAKEQFATARVWDTAKGEKLAELKRFADIAGRPRPGLAAWRTGDGQLDLRVALACGDKALRLWDPAADKVDQPADVAFSGVALAGPGRDRVVTLNPGVGVFRPRLWTAPAGREPASAAPENIRVDTIAWAGALVPRPGGGPLVAAAVSGPSGAVRKYRLQLTDLAGGKKADVPLWEGSAKQPAVAASPDGRFVAAAGNDDHSVLVFATADLLGGGAARPQVLRGIGQTFHKVGFVKKGDRLGLRLSAPGEAVFDVAGRAFADPAGWEPADADAGGWKADVRAADPAAGRPTAAVTVTGPGQDKPASVYVVPGHEVTGVALRPARDGQPPLLALATHVRGQPRLGLYDARTGTWLRQYTGHSDRPFAVAFSGDGRLLASVGEDQTACVYSLTDLDRVVGKRGRLPGLIVAEKPGGVGLLRLTGEWQGERPLAAGDVVAAVEAGGRRTPVKTPRDFYVAVEAVLPGAKLSLVKADGGVVPLAAGQGVDERKPLFSLFAARADAGGLRGWIGWSPLGPYDRSAPAAERFIGWHFNTGDPAGPTRFATADQYREAYYREGILARLVADGELREVPPAQRPKPQMGLRLRDLGAPDADRVVRTRQAAVTLDLDIPNRPFDTVGDITVSLNGGPPRPLNAERREDAIAWAADLRLARGENKLRVTVRTKDERPVEVTEEFAAVYQPPPPGLNLAGAGQRVMVRRNQYDLAAEVAAGEPGEKLVVRARHVADGKAVFDGELPVEEGKVARRLELRPGENVIEVSAGYADADEATRQTVVVTYVRESPPPRIILEAVRVPGGPKVPLDPARPAVVSAGRVRLTGRVEAKEPLAEATVSLGEALPEKLAGLEPGRSLALAIDQELVLQPGRQEVRVKARAASGDPAASVVAVEFRPPVPDVVVTAPEADATVEGDGDAATVRLAATLAGPLDRPFAAAVLVDGKPLPRPPAVEGDRLTAEVSLTPGRHRFAVRLTNEWGAVSESNVVALRFARPPKVLAVEARADGAAAAVTARVKSPTPLTGVTVRVNGQARAAKPQTADNGDGTFTVRLAGVDLEAGRERHELTVTAANADGEAAAPGRAVVVVPRAEPKAEIDFLQPSRDAVAVPEVRVQFRVRSASPLKAVRLVPAAGDPVVFDVAKAERSPSAAHELTVTADVVLKEGVNALRAEAVNAGGMAERVLPVTLIEPPVRILVDRLEPDDGSPPVRARPGANGTVEFDAVPTGRARLIGRLAWGRTAPAEKPDVRVRVFVNGFQRLPARPLWDEGDGRSTPFRADLVFARSAANAVKLQLEGGGQDTTDRNEFAVDCRKPLDRQRLHVLIVSTRSQDRDELKRKVLEAVGSKADGAGAAKTPAFERVLTYGPLADPDKVGPFFVDGQLGYVKETIRTFDRTRRSGNDVVMVYVEGGEAVGANGNVFRADAGGPGLSGDQLLTTLGKTPGAAVVLLDVERQGAGRPGEDRVARWRDFYAQDHPHVGAVRYLWDAARGGAGRPEARLLPAMKEALPGAGKLGPVTLLIGRLAEANRQLPDWLSFARFVPGDLGELALGGVGGE